MYKYKIYRAVRLFIIFSMCALMNNKVYETVHNGHLLKK